MLVNLRMYIKMLYFSGSFNYFSMLGRLKLVVPKFFMDDKNCSFVIKIKAHDEGHRIHIVQENLTETCVKDGEIVVNWFSPDKELFGQ